MKLLPTTTTPTEGSNQFEFVDLAKRNYGMASLHLPGRMMVLTRVRHRFHYALNLLKVRLCFPK